MRSSSSSSSSLVFLTSCLLLLSSMSACLCLGVAVLAPVPLGRAAPFALLAASTITNSGPSKIVGLIGVSPGSALTGFPPGKHASGAVHRADSDATLAQMDVATAYTNAASRTGAILLESAELAGRTLLSGVYKSATSMALTGTVTLDGQGDPDAVWIFQSSSTLVTSSSAKVLLVNAAQSCNVFWQVSSSATLGTGTRFSGTILALTSISVKDGVAIDGRLLARNGAVTLINNQVSSAKCGEEAVLDVFVPPRYPAPTTPLAGEGSALCQLDSLQFTSGLSIMGQFSSTKYEYQCSCNTFTAAEFSTVIKAHVRDDSSSAEVRLNGEEVNDRASFSALSNNGSGGLESRSPYAVSAPLIFRTGWNTILIGVVNEDADCNFVYTIRCEKPSFLGASGQGEGSVAGDPQFVGLRGQKYQVHGVSGEVYNLVSDTHLQFNARFVFLERGQCPPIVPPAVLEDTEAAAAVALVGATKLGEALEVRNPHGRRLMRSDSVAVGAGCWSHAGSYLGELGLESSSGDRVLVRSGPANQGFLEVAVNGVRLLPGQERIITISSSGSLGGGMEGIVSRQSSHAVSVQIDNWAFSFDNSDRFINQHVRVIDDTRGGQGMKSHGLIGQTWSENTYPNAVKHVQGDIDDYRTEDLFNSDFVFNRFKK